MEGDFDAAAGPSGNDWLLILVPVGVLVLIEALRTIEARATRSEVAEELLHRVFSIDGKAA